MAFPWVSEMAVPLFFIAVAALVAGGILLINRFLGLLSLSKKSRRRRRAMLQAFQVLGSGCVFVFGLLLLMLALYVRTYEVFTKEEPVARIQCVPLDGLDYDMILRFVPLEEGEEGTPELFRLSGDQWAVGGHILQWHPWLNILGLHTGFRITRIQGRYTNAEDEASRSRTVHDLGNTRTERIWHWLYRHHEDIPLVKAVYGNTAYTFPMKDRTFIVRVTLSGFMVGPDQQR